MTNLLRLAFMIVLVVGVALAAALLEPQWAHDLSLDSWTEVNLQGEMFGVHPTPGELDEQARMVKKRLSAKNELIKELLNGRLTLFETAAGFQRLNEELPMAGDKQSIAGVAEEERLCQQVIEWVRVELIVNPGEASEDFVARLEQQLLRHKQKNGTVQLPAVFASH
jgi:hypothetical protein